MRMVSLEKAIKDNNWEEDNSYSPSTENDFLIRGYYFHDIINHTVYYLTSSEKYIRIIQKGHRTEDNIKLFEGRLVSADYFGELNTIMRQVVIDF